MDREKPRLNLFLTIVFLIQGIAALLPWNAIISIPSFFHYFLESEKSYSEMFDEASNVSFMVSNILITALMLIPFSKKTTRFMAFASYLITTVAFTYLLGVAIANKISPAGFFYSSIFWIIMLGGCTSIIQMFLFSFSSRLAPIFSTSMLIGQAIAGFFISMSGYLILYASISSGSGLDARGQGIIYFSIVVATCLLASIFAFFLPVMVQKQEVGALTQPENKPNTSMESLPESNATSPATMLADDMAEEMKPSLSLFSIYKAIWFQSIMIFLGFFVTLVVFPAITMNIYTQALPKTDPGYANQQNLFVSATFVVFNAFDIVGRIIPMLSSAVLRRFQRSEVPSNLFLTVFSLLRVALIPLLIFCDLSKKRSSIPTFIRSDALSFLFIALLPTTGGAVAAWTFVAAPQVLVKDTASTEQLLHASSAALGSGAALGMRPFTPAEKSKAGKIMNFSMLLGITLGLAFSRVLAYAVRE